MTFLSPRTKTVILLLGSLAGACLTVGDGDSAQARRGEPLELERLQVGSVYGIGSRFESDDLEFVVAGFGEGLGNAEVARAIEAGAASPSKGAAKTLRLSHAMLQVREGAVNHLEFDFIDNGGPVGLVIAGETLTAADFIELDGARIGSTHVAVSESSTAGVRHGRVVISGALGKFAIAGSDLELADLRLSRD